MNRLSLTLTRGYRIGILACTHEASHENTLVLFPNIFTDGIEERVEYSRVLDTGTV